MERSGSFGIHDISSNSLDCDNNNNNNNNSNHDNDTLMDELLVMSQSMLLARPASSKKQTNSIDKETHTMNYGERSTDTLQQQQHTTTQASTTSSLVWPTNLSQNSLHQSNDDDIIESFAQSTMGRQFSQVDDDMELLQMSQSQSEQMNIVSGPVDVLNTQQSMLLSNDTTQLEESPNNDIMNDPLEAMRIRQDEIYALQLQQEELRNSSITRLPIRSLATTAVNHMTSTKPIDQPLIYDYSLPPTNGERFIEASSEHGIRFFFPCKSRAALVE
jgi:hypothetical protein